MVYKALWLVCALSLSGCATMTTPTQSSDIDPVDASLLAAAKSVSQMAGELNAVQVSRRHLMLNREPAANPYIGFPLPVDVAHSSIVGPDTGPLALRTKFMWDGRADMALSAMAHYIGWEYREVGSTNGSPLMSVSIHSETSSAFDIFKSIGDQIGHGATVVVDEANGRIILHRG